MICQSFSLYFTSFQCLQKIKFVFHKQQEGVEHSKQPILPTHEVGLKVAEKTFSNSDDLINLGICDYFNVRLCHCDA